MRRRRALLSIATFVLALTLFHVIAAAGEKKKSGFVVPKKTFKVTRCMGRLPIKLPGPGDEPVMAYFAGSVELTQGELKVYSDALVAWIAEVSVDEAGGPENRTMIVEFYAEGNVLVTDGKDFLEADRIYYDVPAEKGIVKNARLRATRLNVERYRRANSLEEAEEPPDLGPRATLPLFARAEKLRIVGRNSYKAENSGFSTCSFAKPHWGLKSSEASISPTGEIAAKGNVFDVWGLPIPLPPLRIHKDFRPPLRRLRYSYSSRFRHQIMTEWNVWSRNRLKVGFMLDRYSARGNAWGGDIEYGGKNLEKNPFYGVFESYAIHDTGEDVEGTPLEEKDRYRVRLAHRHVLPWNTRLEAEAFVLSDRDFLRYYLEREYRDGRPRENYVFLKKTDGARALTLFGKAQVNDFYNQAEYLPELGIYSYGERLGWGVYGDMKTRAGYAGREFDNATGVEGYHTPRVDMLNMITRPMNFGPYLYLTPFANIRMSAWKDLYYSDEDLNLYRGTVDVGLHAATEFSRIFDFKSKGLGINGLRHLVRPETRWSVNAAHSLSEGYLPEIDEIENSVPENRLTLTLTNVLQTKVKTDKARGGMQVVDFAKMELEIPYIFEKNEVKPEDPWEDFSWDFELLLGRYASVESVGWFDVNDGETTRAGSGVVLKWPDVVSTYLGGRYEHGEKRTFIGKMSFTPTKKWDFHYAVTTDMLDTEKLQQGFLVRRHFHEWVLEIAYEVDYTQQDRAFSVVFSPLGVFKSKPRFFRLSGGEFDPTMK